MLAGVQLDLHKNAGMESLGDHVILPDVRLGLTQRILASETYQDVASAHHIVLFTV